AQGRARGRARQEGAGARNRGGDRVDGAGLPQGDHRSGVMNEPTATIYDLGYKRYLGTRRSQATRWQVIARQQIAYAWAKWWRLKLYLGIAAIITAIFAAILVFAHSDSFGSLKHNGQFIKRVDE